PTNHNGDETTREEITREEMAAAKLTAYALGQLQGEERAEFERTLTANTDGTSERSIREIQALAAAFSAARTGYSSAATSPELRKAIEKRLDHAGTTVQPANNPNPATAERHFPFAM